MSVEKVGKEYQELAEFITKEIFGNTSDDLTVGYHIIKKFVDAGWVWVKMDDEK